MHFITSALLDYHANGRVRGADGNAHAEYAPSGVYPAAGDEVWVAIAAPTEAAWESLCRVADRGWERDPRFASAGGRMRERAALDEALGDWSRGLSADALETRLQAQGVPAHRASTSADLMRDPQLAARGHLVWLEHPECGRVPVESARAILSRTPASAAWTGPTHGQHNETVLRDLLGLSDDEIASLVLAGALD